VVDTDRYGRTVGTVTLPDGLDLGQQLVKAGLAWWYEKYAPGDQTLAALQTAAKSAGVGLWSDANPIPPWEWRAGNRSGTAKPSTPATPVASVTETYWLNTDSNVRHNSGAGTTGIRRWGECAGRRRVGLVGFVEGDVTIRELGESAMMRVGGQRRHFGNRRFLRRS